VEIENKGSTKLIKKGDLKSPFLIVIRFMKLAERVFFL
jgi:hypothetical protein